jgi:glycosyltransferase involved in cell wall biosynthesis
MITYFLIPVYNETANLELLSKRLKEVLPGREKLYVFSDDGSSDDSVDQIKKLFDGTNHMVLGDGSNHGPGYAFNKGFEWILQHSKDQNDLVVTVEADNTSDLKILPNMISMSDMGFDLVLASVYAQGGGFDKTTFLRKLLSFGANFLLRFVYDIKVLTLSSFYRVYRVGIINKVQQKYPMMISETGFISMIELLIKIIRCNGEVIEYPMKLSSANRVGKSKMKVTKTFFSYLRFLLFNSRH